LRNVTAEAIATMLNKVTTMDDDDDVGGDGDDGDGGGIVLMTLRIIMK